MAYCRLSFFLFVAAAVLHFAAGQSPPIIYATAEKNISGLTAHSVTSLNLWTSIRYNGSVPVEFLGSMKTFLPVWYKPPETGIIVIPIVTVTGVPIPPPSGLPPLSVDAAGKLVPPSSTAESASPAASLSLPPAASTPPSPAYQSRENGTNTDASDSPAAAAGAVAAGLGGLGVAGAVAGGGPGSAAAGGAAGAGQAAKYRPDEDQRPDKKISESRSETPSAQSSVSSTPSSSESRTSSSSSGTSSSTSSSASSSSSSSSSSLNTTSTTMSSSSSRVNSSSTFSTATEQQTWIVPVPSENPEALAALGQIILMAQDQTRSGVGLAQAMAQINDSTLDQKLRPALEKGAKPLDPNATSVSIGVSLPAPLPVAAIVASSRVFYGIVDYVFCEQRAVLTRPEQFSRASLRAVFEFVKQCAGNSSQQFSHPSERDPTDSSLIEISVSTRLLAAL
ncbi:MAG: hypothetical protein M1817_000315 [Caeruleum heppii]|nr:MAG: hypothetical protein M1817_000315 [Caeruleum heppii]